MDEGGTGGTGDRRLGRAAAASGAGPRARSYPKLRYSSMMYWIGLRAWSLTHTS
jgi:hypothetical protein